MEQTDLGRPKPNTSLTEADWRAAMDDFLGGMTDAEVARKWRVSNATVASQRFKRGVYRRDRPGYAAYPMVGAMQSVAAERVAERRVERAEADAAAAPAPPVLRPAQTPPEGFWRTWLFLGGRGAGKTLAGAAWLAGRAKAVGRLALVGPTIGDVREVMIEGPSGLRGLAAAFGPHAEQGLRPVYEPSRRRLTWPNGAHAYVFSAEDADALRGPQFAAAWADELCAWPHSATKSPDETLAMLRMGLRLGDDPRLVLTTTPRPTAGLARLLAEPGLVRTAGSALENAAHLAPGFLEGLRDLYGGTRLERQEIDGEVLEALQGAVFRRADIDRARRLGAAPEGPPARFEAIVVAVDPPAGLEGAACGIVVAGRTGRRAWVLDDMTAQGLSPLGWARRVGHAADAYAARGPVSVVAEANQGGEMVREVLRAAEVHGAVRLVHARAGKAARAEPVALLYEQGRAAHVAGLEALEEQLLLLGAAGREAGGAGRSPDRADALVWALTALMLDIESRPRIRVL